MLPHSMIIDSGGADACAGTRLGRRRLLQAMLASATAGAGGSMTQAAPPLQSSATVAPDRHRIDVHHHIAPPAFVAELRSSLQPQILAWTPEKSLEDMDRAGVATAITSITTPGVWLGDDVQGRRLARVSNDYGARLRADHPGRFELFAAVPLPDIEGSLREIEYGLDQLNAQGIALFTSYRDKWLGDPAFDPVMEELNRRSAVVYTHPEAPLCCRGLFPGLFNDAVIEYATDTTRAVASLLFHGTVARYRNIRWIFSHGGGTVPFLAERLESVPRSNPRLAALVPDGVMAELRRFYYDIAQASHPAALAALTRIAPVSRLLWGTDFPFRRGEEYVRQLAAYGFSADDLRQIDRDNALALMPRLHQQRS